MNESVLVGVMQGVVHGRHQHRGVPIIEPLSFQPFELNRSAVGKNEVSIGS